MKFTSTTNRPFRPMTTNDAAHMPYDYSTTSGGTLFSTTPGGSYIPLASLCYSNMYRCWSYN
uniref:Uncharacterized protein n=1 Tax=Esox lucius TaxID=8010 RepID=A0A3P8XLH1_ESOLU